MKLILGTLILLFVTSFSSQAALISHNGYTLNTDTNIVTGGGLEWLQWDETTGESINSALATYGSQGWRLASNVEMASLFSTFFPEDDLGNSASWPTDENISTGISSEALLQMGDPLYTNFLDIFGRTFGYDIEGSPNPNDPANNLVIGIGTTTGALFGSDGDGDGLYNNSSVILVINNNVDPNIFFTDRSSVTMFSDGATPDFSRIDLGISLVRPVPIPATVWLFGTTLLGLYGVNRKGL